MQKLNLKWVSESIGDDYKSWRKGDTILVQAQTGTGKTWFVKNTLVDYMPKHERMLLVCNRTNLKRQLKIDLLKKFDKDIPMIKDGDTETIDNDALDKLTTIENITIASYHAISRSILDAEYEQKQFNIHDFMYIILDESHFLFTDASFNNKTRLVCEELLDNNAHDSIKIFISATMEEIEAPIRYRIDKSPSKSEVRTYKTGIDYSYVNPKYLKNNISTITNTILNDKTEEKWLIFVSSKVEGDKVLKILGNDICSTIYSNTKSNELNSIINNSKFNKKVLVCTRCLDNGINIEDSLLINIVIMAWDRVTFLQMLGRKRVDINNAQEINLYITTRFKKSFLTKVFNCKKEYAEIELLSKDENAFNRKYDNDFKAIAKLEHLFYRDNATGKWRWNPAGVHRLSIDMDFFKQMVTVFDDIGEYAFILKQLEWLGLTGSFDENNILDEVVLDEQIETLESYLEGVVGKRLYSEDQQLISNLVIKELTTLTKNIDYRTKKLRPATVETIFRDQLRLPYAVSKSKTEDKIVDGKRIARRYIVINNN